MLIAKPNDPTIILESNHIHVIFDERFAFIDEPKWMQIVFNKIEEMRAIAFTSKVEMINRVSDEMIIIQNDALHKDEFVPKLCLQRTTQSYTV